MERASGEGTATGECAACGSLAGVERFCEHCGFEVLREEADGIHWPNVGAVVAAVELRAPLASVPGSRRFLGVRDEDRFEVLVTPLSDPQRIVAARAEARAALDDLALTPTDAADQDELRYTFTRLPNAPSLREGLAAIVAEREDGGPDELVARWILPVARAFARVHAAGLYVGNPDPAEILVGEEGDCWFRQPPLLTTGGGAARSCRATRGFVAPEVRGRCGGQVDARSDVFFIGISLFYALARIAPLNEAGESNERLPPPHIYRSDVPPEVAAVVYRAVSLVPSRRYANAGDLNEALERALQSDLERRRVGGGSLLLDIGHELHIGVLKGQYAPTNQDDLFLAYHGQTGIGLFLISDGVSISEHGTGDMASGCVRQETVAAWRSIVEGRADGDDIEAVDGGSLGELHPVLPASFEGRCDLLRGVLDAANTRIGHLLHERMPRFPGPPEGIMAATAVLVLLDRNKVTLCSIGDSRVYLVRDGHLTSLMVDHDLATQLMRMGRPPSFARSVQAAAALIRCVGEFEKDKDDRLVPVPLQPEFRALNLLPGDTLVLTSDGIPDYAGTDEEDAERRILEAVESAPGSSWAAFELMVAANRGGGGDNISCIVLRFGQSEDPG